jgi:biopolymer transport protein ExbD
MSESLMSRPRRRPELNLVPLIDVLVMLIFFSFVTMQFKSATTMNITLPKMDTAGKNQFKGTVTIDIDKDGNIAVNEKRVTDDELIALLQQLHDADPDTPVLIKADETSQLKKVAFVWDACNKTGLNKFSMQTR